MGKALYRKYRPTKLADVVGQDTVTAALAQSIKSGKISHAYLFTGPRGCGKTSVARIFAHEINQLPYELEDSHLDIIEIDAASNTGVDNIRELREKAIIAPSSAKYKVYIIDEVHMLSKSAFNALLKLMEEPPEHVVFIMATTNPEKVPVTITSRAQVYTFKLASTEVLQKHLGKIAESEKLKIDDAALELIARRGAGSFRDAISLLDQISTLSSAKITTETVTQALGLPQDQVIKDLLAAYQAGDSAKITTLLQDLLSSGTRAELIAEELINQIVSAPEPKLLPLLAALPDVKAPFTEAKLLVAMLSGGAVSNFSTVPSLSGTSYAGTPAEPPLRANPSGASGIYVAAKEGGNTVEKSLPTPPTTFSWANYLEQIKSESIHVHQYLEKCQHQVQDSTLHLYPPRNFEKRMLEHSNNHQLLIAHATGLTIEIHDEQSTPASQPTANSAPLSKISDIMGNVQEVNDGGAIPF